jgi:hypothetical protein
MKIINDNFTTTFRIQRIDSEFAKIPFRYKKLFQTRPRVCVLLNQHPPASRLSLSNACDRIAFISITTPKAEYIIKIHFTLIIIL